MSYDLYYGGKSFTIGYSASELLNEIFNPKPFWFSGINEKKGLDTTNIILDAICKIERLPEEGTIKDKNYSRARYFSLIEQLGYMYKLTQESPEETWDISL